MRCGFLTIDPFVGIPVFIAKLSERQYCWRVLEDFHCQEYFQFFDTSSCVCTSPLAVMTIVGLHDFVKESMSALLKSFLLIMCIDAPESTTKSRSSGLRFDASKHIFSEGEKNVALSCPWNFNTMWTSFHAASRAPCSCHSVSSWERSSNFGALGLRSSGSPGQILRDVRQLLWSVSACLSFSAKPMKTTAAAYPEIRTPIVV